MAKIPKLGRVTQRKDDRIDEEGYRVSGMFKLFGWNQYPRAIGEKMQAALSKPPKVVYYGRSRS